MQPLTDRLMALYGPPASDRPVAYVAEVERIAGLYSAAEQDRAGSRMIDQTEFVGWPALGRIAKALSDAREDLAPKPGPAPDPYPQWTKRRQRLADRLIAGPLGRQAADAGWLGSLWHFCRREGRLPAASEIAALKVEAREADAAEESIYRVGGPMVPALSKLADARREHESRLIALARSDSRGASQSIADRITGDRQ